MGKKLSQLSSEELKAEMSIAGSPDKMMQMKDKIFFALIENVDQNNPAELINADFVLRRLQAEIRLWGKQYGERTGQLIKF